LKLAVRYHMLSTVGLTFSALEPPEASFMNGRWRG
jgi:hypothetical protein